MQENKNDRYYYNSNTTGKSKKTAKIVILLLLAILVCAGVLAYLLLSGGSQESGGLKNDLGAAVSQDAQSVTVTADKHASKNANAYMVDLYSDKDKAVHLICRFMPDRRHDENAQKNNEVTFNELNPGEPYTIKVTECRQVKRGYKEAKNGASSILKIVPLETEMTIFGEGDMEGNKENRKTDVKKEGTEDGEKDVKDDGKENGTGISAGDFQNEVKKPDDKINGKVYPDKEKIRSILENAAIARKKKISFYYPEKVPDFGFTDGSLLLDDEISSIAYTWYYYNDKNDFGQKITIMGKEYYRYDFHFDYHYSKAKQAKYLPKILKIKKRLKGTAADKVKKFDSYFRKNCVYDKSLIKGDPYDAIVGGEAVCDGYARAAYILLNMAGAPCEYIYGRGNGGSGWESHAWNINKVDGKWYQSDFTWDSSLDNTSFLMKGSGNKKFNRMHVIDDKFKKRKWVKDHPMSKKDY